MTNGKLAELLDAYDDAERAVQAAMQHRTEIKKQLSGLTFRQAQAIARRGHFVARPHSVMGWRPYQLLDDTKPNHYVGTSAKAWTRKDYQSRGMETKASNALTET